MLSYTTEFLTKKAKVNEGEIPQYCVENNHEAIIEPEVFEMVQREILKRGRGKKYHSGMHIFSTKIKWAVAEAGTVLRSGIPTASTVRSSSNAITNSIMMSDTIHLIFSKMTSMMAAILNITASEKNRMNCSKRHSLFPRLSKPPSAANQ